MQPAELPRREIDAFQHLAGDEVERGGKAGQRIAAILQAGQRPVELAGVAGQLRRGPVGARRQAFEQVAAVGRGLHADGAQVGRIRVAQEELGTGQRLAGVAVRDVAADGAAGIELHLDRHLGFRRDGDALGGGAVAQELVAKGPQARQVRIDLGRQVAGFFDEKVIGAGLEAGAGEDPVFDRRDAGLAPERVVEQDPGEGDRRAVPAVDHRAAHVALPDQLEIGGERAAGDGQNAAGDRFAKAAAKDVRIGDGGVAGRIRGGQPVVAGLEIAEAVVAGGVGEGGAAVAALTAEEGHLHLGDGRPGRRRRHLAAEAAGRRAGGLGFRPGRAAQLPAERAQAQNERVALGAGFLRRHRRSSAARLRKRPGAGAAPAGPRAASCSSWPTAGP